MAFKPLSKVSEYDLERYLIANSEAIAVGDTVIGNATAANSTSVKGAKNTTGDILGVVVSIIGDKGKVLEKDSITVASDNETNAKVAVNIIPARLPVKYEVDLSAASGTTTGSAGIGMFNLSATLNGTLNEGSYVVQTGTAAQFLSLGAAPDNSSKVRGYIRKIA